MPRTSIRVKPELERRVRDNLNSPRQPIHAKLIAHTRALATTMPPHDMPEGKKSTVWPLGFPAHLAASVVLTVTSFGSVVQFAQWRRTG